MEGFIISSLPHLAVEEIKLSMAPLLQRHYSPSSLLRATPPAYRQAGHPAAFDPFPVSAVIGPTCSADFSVGHSGLPCLCYGRQVQFPSRPCYRVAAITPPVWFTSFASVRYPILSSPHIDWFDHRFLAFTRLAQRSITLQPGHSLISPKLTLPVCVQRTGRSVGSSISITLHAAAQAIRLRRSGTSLIK